MSCMSDILVQCLLAFPVSEPLARLGSKGNTISPMSYLRSTSPMWSAPVGDVLLRNMECVAQL
jgi:hypothetical protein